MVRKFNKWNFLLIVDVSGMKTFSASVDMLLLGPRAVSRSAFLAPYHNVSSEVYA